MTRPACVAMTGLDTFWGRALAERLLASDAAPRIVGLDLHRPLRLAGRITFHRVDLTEPTADGKLAEILANEAVDVVVHLAFRRSPTSDIEADHELETLGSLHVMNGCGAAGVRRLVVASSTMLYGPRPDNPNFLSESHPLSGHLDAHCVQNRVEVEALLASWSRRHPRAEVTVLRSAWPVGPHYSDHIIAHFDQAVVPSVLGYDPLIQFVHESDLVRVYELATLEPHPGVFNVVAPGVLPLSTLLALAGKRRVAVPAPILYRLSSYAHEDRAGDAPAGFYDYFRYLCVADGERGWAEFGRPVYTTKEAWIDLIASRRMARAS